MKLQRATLRSLCQHGQGQLVIPILHKCVVAYLMGARVEKYVWTFLSKCLKEISITKKTWLVKLSPDMVLLIWISTIASELRLSVNSSGLAQQNQQHYSIQRIHNIIVKTPGLHYHILNPIYAKYHHIQSIVFLQRKDIKLQINPFCDRIS